MKIRIVKPPPPDRYEGKTLNFLKYNTIEINLDEFCGILANEYGTHRIKRNQVMELLEQYLQLKLESK